MFLVGVYLVLQTAGLSQIALSVIGGAGVLGIVIGFAFRDIAENFLASLLLSLRQPFRRGDYIRVAEQEGTVRAMTTRSTILTAIDGTEVQIPNAIVLKNIIENLTSGRQKRDRIEISIGGDVSAAEARAVIAKALEGLDAVVRKPQPMVLVEKVTGAAVTLGIYFWVDIDAHSAVKVRSAVLSTVTCALGKEEVSVLRTQIPGNKSFGFAISPKHL